MPLNSSPPNPFPLTTPPKRADNACATCSRYAPRLHRSSTIIEDCDERKLDRRSAKKRTRLDSDRVPRLVLSIRGRGAPSTTDTLDSTSHPVKAANVKWRQHIPPSSSTARSTCPSSHHPFAQPRRIRPRFDTNNPTPQSIFAISHPIPLPTMSPPSPIPLSPPRLPAPSTSKHKPYQVQGSTQPARAKKKTSHRT